MTRTAKKKFESLHHITRIPGARVTCCLTTFVLWYNMHDTSIRGAWVSDVDNKLHDAMRSWGDVIMRSWTKTSMTVWGDLYCSTCYGLSSLRVFWSND